jgi:prophage antirepressor-like protein/predicted transcriptional regulator
MTHATNVTSITAFHGTLVTIIDHAGQRWLTAKEVGLCLGYAEANAQHGIGHLFNRHKDEFEEGKGLVNLTHPCDTIVIKLMTKGGMQETRLFSLTGCTLLGFFSNTARAKDFRVWAKQVLAGALHGMPPTAAAPNKRFVRITVTRQMEFDVLSLFIQGMPQSQIAKQLRVSPGAVSLLLHGRYHFAEEAGQDLTTPALLDAVVARHMRTERERIIKKYCTSASNQQLTSRLDNASLQLLTNDPV